MTAPHSTPETSDIQRLPDGFRFEAAAAPAAPAVKFKVKVGRAKKPP